MSSPQDPRRQLRRVSASRDRWEGRVADKQRSIRYLEVKVRDLEASRDAWRRRALAAEEAAHAQPPLGGNPRQAIRPGPNGPRAADGPRLPGPHPARHWFCLFTCLLGLQIHILARCRLRAAAPLLGILGADLPAVQKPSHETLRRWLLRIGLRESLRPIARLPDWIWLIDHSAPVGPDKALLVIAVTRSVLLEKQGALTPRDVRALGLDVVASSTGEQVEQRLRALVARRRAGADRQRPRRRPGRGHPPAAA